MAHAAPAYTAHAHRPRTGATTGLWAGLPLLLGIVYGFWTSGIRRVGEPITTGNVMFGVVTGLLFAAVFFALHRFAPALPRELRALSWTAFAGIAFGFLYSQTDASVLRSVGMSLAVSALTFVAVFYRYYTRE